MGGLFELESLNQTLLNNSCMNDSRDLFIDKTQAIDREALRVYVFDQLTKCKQLYKKLLTSEEGYRFIRKLHDYIAERNDLDQNRYWQVEHQLSGLGEYLDTWVVTAIDSQERLDFFIRAKAAEISSGDAKRDYYWAMQIRHDQLVALVRVIELLLHHIKRFLQLEPSQVLEDPVFLGLVDYSIEEQVYLEAEKVHRQRLELQQTLGL